MDRIRLKPEQTICETGDLYGIFFEDINHAADGGLYAQMVQNYAFEFSAMDNSGYRALTAWEILEPEGARLSVSVLDQDGFSRENPHYLTVEVTKAEEPAGFQNVGYNRGMYFEKGQDYLFSCYARNEGGRPGRYRVSLRGAGGGVYAEGELRIDSPEWKKYTLELTAGDTDDCGRLALTTEKEGCVSFDFISLFPRETFRGRENGLRRDIGQLLADMKPKFMRFPGGSLVHDGSMNINDRNSVYRWKNTIGDVVHRPARRNHWNYNQTGGLGYYEYFLFCEDIGAKPVPVLPAGYSSRNGQGVPMARMQEWVDDALDLIEFANGDIDTKWGSLRARLGHPGKFHLEYIGIGNEAVGEGFFDRYPLFHRAIKEKYPQIKIINSAGPFPAGRDFVRGWESAEENHSDLVDEHYYVSPEWMLANTHRYDDYDPEGAKVLVGEYGSWGNTYYNALCEAAYMTSLERNADKVGMACYAPLLCNADYCNWAPDLIWFDNHRAFGSANYYVQKLFMNHQGTCRIGLEWEGAETGFETDGGPIVGELRLKPLRGSVSYSDIKVIDHVTGRVEDFADVTLRQGDSEHSLGRMESSDYTVQFRAVRKSGIQGFCMAFGQRDARNYYEWSLSGRNWGSTEVISYVDKKSSCLGQDRFRIQDGVSYLCCLHVRGRAVYGVIEGCAAVAAYDRPLEVEKLYCAASADRESGDVILKAVNVRKRECQVQICLEGARGADIYEMCGYEADDTNSFEEPLKVVPAERYIPAEDEGVVYTFQPRSVTVMRFHMAGAAGVGKG